MTATRPSRSRPSSSSTSRAGLEPAIASTKTFSSTWHALAQLVEALKGSALDGLDELPGYVDRTVTWALDSALPVELLNVAGY